MHQRLEGSAFLPALGNQVIPGTIVLTHIVLRFESAEATIEIPTTRLVAEVRPGDEQRITFTDPDLPGVEIFSSELDLLGCPLAPLTKAREDCTARLSRGELKRRWRVLGGFVVACAVLTIAGNFFTSHMVRAIAARVTPDWDARFGAGLMAEIAKDEEFVTDSNAVARIVTLAEPLLQVLPKTTNGFQFHIVRNEDPNAFAVPGGHIVIHTGLLELTHDPEELLGVLAHEVAHVTERHMYRKTISTAGPLIICELFFSRAKGWGDMLGGGAALLVGAGFSQAYETEADNVGWNYLMAARIDPRGMIRVFQKLKRADEQRSQVDLTPQAFSSHPAAAKRIKRLESRWAKLSRKPAFIEFPAPPDSSR